MQTFNMHFDLGYLKKSKVVIDSFPVSAGSQFISDSFPVHARENERNKIIISWKQYGKFKQIWSIFDGFHPTHLNG